MRRVHLFLMLLALSLEGGFAQDPVQSYFAVAGNQAVIYHGKEQLKYPPNLLNHPYLVSDTYETGELSFEGILYQNVKMRLDLNREELTILSPDNRLNIILPSDRVDYANLRGYHIFYHYTDNTKGCPPNGYYLKLHDSGLKVLERQTSVLFQTIKDGEIESSFANTVRYYVLKEGVYYNVKSKGSVLKVLKDRKAELGRFIRREKLDFKRGTEKAIVEVVREYERLNKKP